MFLTDFRMRKYTGGIISRVGIFLTVTPVTVTIWRIKPEPRNISRADPTPCTYHFLQRQQGRTFAKPAWMHWLEINEFR